jgi:multidrug efflux pump subunit AcrA (membrane-fusion protein)
VAERRTLPHWARWTAVGCTVAVLGAGTYLVVDALPSRAATSGMRTATVATGSVTQSTSLSGSVERVDLVTAAFRTAGTVTSVKVAVGDEVEAGDVLARMDTDHLAGAVTVARANLVAAQAALDAAGSSTSSSSSSAAVSSSASAAASAPSSTTSAAAPGGGSGSTPAPSATTSPTPKVDTSGVHRAVGDYDALVQAAVATCQPVIDAGTSPDPTPTPTPSPSASTSPTPSPSPSQTPSVDPLATASPTDAASASDGTTTATVRPANLTTEATDAPTPEQVGACIQALSSALTSAQHTASEMDRLATALDAAAKALLGQRSAAATQGSTGQTTGTGSGSSTGTRTGATGTGSAGGGGGAGGSQSAAGLEVDVLKATQELAAAEQDLDGAVLRAPISGRVGQVDLVEGKQASTSSGVVLGGPGAAVVTVDLPLAQLGRVRVAQDVTVTPAGTTDAVPGLVQSIGVLPSSTTTSTPTYPVRVTVSDAPVSLAAGSTAAVTITLATASDVLTVPVSAVTGVSSGTGSVQVLSGTTVRAAKVTVGAVGQGKVQVESGLTAGQVVVLADPTTALPSSTTFRRSTKSGVSSLTGSGGGAGGPPPGG